LERYTDKSKKYIKKGQLTLLNPYLRRFSAPIVLKATLCSSQRELAATLPDLLICSGLAYGIIAGMADATIVIESADKGGSLITANIAGSYNRDVLAVPGRSTDPYSQGCNQLIRDNKAALIQTADDLLRAMQWIDLAPSKPRQRELFVELTEEEERVVQILTDKEQEHINQIVIQSNISIGQISSILLNLEMKGVIRSLPGCQYARI
jgi:DNA processing protein